MSPYSAKSSTPTRGVTSGGRGTTASAARARCPRQRRSASGRPSSRSTNDARSSRYGPVGRRAQHRRGVAGSDCAPTRSACTAKASATHSSDSRLFPCSIRRGVNSASARAASHSSSRETHSGAALKRAVVVRVQRDLISCLLIATLMKPPPAPLRGSGVGWRGGCCSSGAAAGWGNSRPSIWACSNSGCRLRISVSTLQGACPSIIGASAPAAGSGRQPPGPWPRSCPP